MTIAPLDSGRWFQFARTDKRAANARAAQRRWRRRSPNRAYLAEPLEQRTLLSALPAPNGTGIYATSTLIGSPLQATEFDGSAITVNPGATATIDVQVTGSGTPPMTPTGSVYIDFQGGPGNEGTISENISLSGSNGVATGSAPFTFPKDGLVAGDTYYFTCYYSGDAYYATGEFSNTPILTVNFAITNHLAFIQQPNNTAAGDTIKPPITVAVEDSSGNYQTSSTDSISLSLASSSTGTGTLSGTTTESAVGGIATFSDLSINTNGDYVLTATDNTNPSFATATSSSFTIAPGKLVFLSPPLATTQTAGDPLAPTIKVELEDGSGNAITSEDGAVVTLSLIGSTDANPITGNTAALSGGVATFSNVVLTKPGTYQLQASDPAGDAVGDSIKFGIGGDTLKFLIQPKNAGIGDPLTVKVEALTPKGKVDTTLADAVQLNLNVVSGGVNAALAGTTTVSLVRGIATFTAAAGVSVNASGSYTLGAAALNDGSTDYTVTGAASDPFSIAADHLILKPQPPAQVDVLKPIPFVVEEVDSHGKLNTSENSATATLSLQSATAGSTASLGGTTSATFSGGIASFTTTAGPTIDSPGTFTLVVNESGAADPASPVTTRAIKVIGYYLDNEVSASAYYGGPGVNGPAGRFIAADAAVATGHNGFAIFLDSPDRQNTLWPTGTTVSVSVTPISGNGTLVASSTDISDYVDRDAVDISAPGVYQLTFTAQFPHGSAIPDSAVAPLKIERATYVAPRFTTLRNPSVVAGQDATYANLIIVPNDNYSQQQAQVVPSQSAGYSISFSGGSPDANLPNDFAYAASAEPPNLVIDTPGSYKITQTLVVTPGGLPFDPSNYSVDSNVDPAVTTLRVLPTKLRFVTPPESRIIANSTFTVTVALTDSSGAVLTDFDNSPDYEGAVLAVVLTGKSANGTAGFVDPTTSPVVIVNGIATFPNLSFSQTGVYSLQAELVFMDVVGSGAPTYQVPNTTNLISNLIRVTV